MLQGGFHDARPCARLSARASASASASKMFLAGRAVNSVRLRGEWQITKRYNRERQQREKTEGDAKERQQRETTDQLQNAKSF